MPRYVNGRKTSTKVTNRAGFVLLAGANGEAWISAVERIVLRLGVPVDAYRFGIELVGVEGATAHGIGTDGALLVRPDGFVAWRTEDAAKEPERTLEHVLWRLL